MTSNCSHAIFWMPLLLYYADKVLANMNQFFYMGSLASFILYILLPAICNNTWYLQKITSIPLINFHFKKENVRIISVNHKVTIRNASVSIRIWSFHSFWPITERKKKSWKWSLQLTPNSCNKRLIRTKIKTSNTVIAYFYTYCNEKWGNR